MTVYLRDMSHYDSDLSMSGFVGATHKITEGTSYTDPNYQSHMNTLRADGRVLGSYHVLHTGNLQAQLDFWVAKMDALTPWWRNYPYWINQIDAERWVNDSVSAGTILTFATMLKARALPGRAICYASRGQYGNSLNGIAVDLWNAAYHGTGYPGDGAADWAPYSGKIPVLWQYTDTPYDKNAFRGTISDLRKYVGSEIDMALSDEQLTKPDGSKVTAAAIIMDIWNATFKGGGPAGSLGDRISHISPTLTDTQVTSIASAVSTALAGKVASKADVHDAVVAAFHSIS